MARLTGNAQAAGDEGGTRPHQRIGFRKGADPDEDLWPAKTFGEVSDEQFWHDVASDKPLTITARAAKQDSKAGKRPVDTGQATNPLVLRVTRARSDDRAREGRGRGRGDGTRSAATGGYPEARTTPDPATERTMIQPAYTATQPIPSMTSPAAGMTSQALGATPQASSAALPAENRGRRRPSSTEEDPLTSAAFALRTSGPVDGRSALRAARSRPAGSASGSASGYAGSLPAPTAAYPTHRTTYGDPSSATQAMNAIPPYGENHGYGTRSHARHADMGTGPMRQAYPRDGYPAGNRHGTGGPPATGSYPSAGYPTGGYQGGAYQGGAYQGGGQHGNGYQPGGYPGSGGYQGPGQRAPYDPRDDYRRLTHLR